MIRPAQGAVVSTDTHGSTVNPGIAFTSGVNCLRCDQFLPGIRCRHKQALQTSFIHASRRDRYIISPRYGAAISAALGVKWDVSNKRWYIPLFAQLITERQQIFRFFLLEQ